MRTRLLLVAALAVQVGLTSCLLSEGRVSNRSFLVRTSRGGRSPDPATVQKDVEAVALNQGFRPITFGEPVSQGYSKYKIFHYGLEVTHHGGVTINFGYSAQATVVSIGVVGSCSPECQQVADRFYLSFAQRFAHKYGPGIIAENPL